MRLDDAQAAVAAWHRQRFGDEVPLTWLGLKLAEEAGEVCRELLMADGEPTREGRRAAGVEAEAVDVLIVLLALADRAGFKLSEVLEARWSVVSARRFAEGRGEAS
jgi:NTP pyrophosphatase (non-canonical NTP hydrolase)